MLPDLIARNRYPLVGITVHQATITLRITAEGETAAAARAAMQPTIDTIHQCLGDLDLWRRGRRAAGRRRAAAARARQDARGRRMGHLRPRFRSWLAECRRRRCLSQAATCIAERLHRLERIGRCQAPPRRRLPACSSAPLHRPIRPRRTPQATVDHPARRAAATPFARRSPSPAIPKSSAPAPPSKPSTCCGCT